jgi:hypothetical protein
MSKGMPDNRQPIMLILFIGAPILGLIGELSSRYYIPHRYKHWNRKIFGVEQPQNPFFFLEDMKILVVIQIKFHMLPFAFIAEKIEYFIPGSEAAISDKNQKMHDGLTFIKAHTSYSGSHKRAIRILRRKLQS